jgi:tetratricopeptide (TPR) repeat protein
MNQTEDRPRSEELSPTGSRDGSAAGADEDRLADALEQYRALLEAGQRPDRHEFLARYRDIAAALSECLAGLEFVHEVAPELSRDAAGGTAKVPAAAEDLGQVLPLGDFRLLQEIGRGGMGVVYLAEQLSLGRRVALKVLPFAAALDVRQLQRFKNEAQAAAQLHHTNIVPVYFVGCERGVHYYAMQYIEGQTLAAAIRDLRQRAGLEAGEAGPQAGPGPALADELVSGRWAGAGAADPQLTTAYAPPPVAGAPADDPSAPVTAVLSTERSLRGPAFFRTVARLGAQAAEALEHAHQLGILHRDIKPANLLLDGHGHLWITDFGLAQVRGDAKLTMTGDLVGTLRYMSPEQALAQRVVVDQRTDVYSLGATLYELLTLQPAFGGSDRQELLRQIAFEEPKAPRRINKAIPAELATIVQKAMEKNPADRYATAQELAEDLQRFLADEPIRAQPAGVVRRLRKWGRRHPAVVAAAATALTVAIAVASGGVGWLVNDRATRAEKTANAISTALQESADWQQRRRVPEALSAAQRAQAALLGGHADAAVRRRVEARVNDLELLAQLEEARLEATAVKDGHFDYETMDRRCGEVFRQFRLDVEGGSEEQVGRQIRASTVALELASFLDGWAMLRRTRIAPQAEARWQHLLEVACIADPDAWRTQLRQAMAGSDRELLARLASSEQVAELLPWTTSALARVLLREGAAQRADAVLREAQRRHPDDFWISEDLGLLLDTSNPPRHEEAVPFFMVAVALRPQSPGAHFNLGISLEGKGDVDGAIAEYREAIRLKQDFPEVHVDLGVALLRKGKLDEAIAEFREAIQTRASFPEAYEAHYSLGTALFYKGQLDEAIAEYKEAIQLKKDFPEAHCNLGNALSAKGHLDEAIAEYREALQSKQPFPQAYNAHGGLGDALRDKGQLDEAIAEIHEALRLKKDNPEAHCSLGAALRAKGRTDEAIAECHEALRLKKDNPEAHTNLGMALYDKGQLDEAIDEYREALQSKQRFPQAYIAHNGLGTALHDKGKLDEAIAEFHQAMRLRKDWAAAHHNLAVALSKKGMLDDAIVEYRVAIRLCRAAFQTDSTLCAMAHKHLGDLLRDKFQFDQAIPEYREVIRLKKDSSEAHNDLGLALLRGKGDVDAAIGEFRAAIQIDPNCVNSHLNMVTAYFWLVRDQHVDREQNLEQAIGECRIVLELDSKNLEAHRRLTWFLREKGDLDGSIREARLALQIQPNSDTHYELGESLLSKGLLDEAIAEFREALRINKDHALAHYNLGNTLYAKGQLDEAIAEYRQVLRIKKDDALAHYSLGGALREKGQLDEAIDECREAIRIKKDYPEAHTNLGLALKDKGQVEEAIAEYRQALQSKQPFPEAYKAHYNLANALDDKGRLDEAVAEYREALRLKEGYAEAHTNLGAALWKKGQLDEAIAECREALRLKKDDPEAHNNLGNALKDKGQLDEAIAEYRQALQSKQPFPEAYIAHTNLGNALHDKGQLDEAIAECREALRLKNDFAEAHESLGAALLSKGKLDEAIAEFHEALRFKEDYAEAHNNLGNALLAKDQLDEAIAECREALRLKRDFPEAHYNLGNALLAKGQLDEAIAEYREVLRLKKDYPEAHNNLGNVLKDTGQLDEAIAEYREALRLKKEYPQAHYNLGNALKDKGHLDEAIAEYRQAIRLRKDYAKAHCNLGDLLLRQGKFQAAVEEIRVGHELGSRSSGWSYPSAQWLRNAERLAHLDGRLPALLKGHEQPMDAGERLALAQLCQLHKQLFVAAARWYGEAFTAQPPLAEDLSGGYRYDAACAAALAGCGQGKDANVLGDEERARLRRQALDWLRADLQGWRRLLEKGPNTNRPAIAQQLKHWLVDTDFVGVRGEQALAGLPRAERADWQQLWKEVEALRQRAARPPDKAAAPRP